MKTFIYWIVIALLFVSGIASQWLPFNSTLNALGVWALVFVICIVPGWLLGSSQIVKVAIECAQKGNWAGVRGFLISRGWLIFPSTKYNDIILLLRQLAENPSQKPSHESPEFSRYIVNDGMGYILTWDGKEKMLAKIGSGLFTWRIVENPTVIKWVTLIIVICAVIRGLAALIGVLLHH